MTNNSPWQVMDQYDPDLHDDEPYQPTPLTQALAAAAISFIIGLALYGGAQIVANIVASVS